jgi:hypothetical protein
MIGWLGKKEEGRVRTWLENDKNLNFFVNLIAPPWLRL